MASTNEEEEYCSSPEEWEDVDDQSSSRTASDYGSGGDESDGDLTYSDDDDDDDGGGDSSCGEEETEEEDEDAMAARRSREKRYGVLTMDALRALQEEHTARVADLTLLPPALAAAVLRHCKWSAAAVEDRWFSGEQRVRDAVGLPGSGSGCCATNPAPLTCAICFDAHGAGEMRAAACAAHFYCLGCWRGYLRAAVADGARCLSLRCPDPSCPAAVARDLVSSAADPDDARRYDEFALRSFVEESKGSIRWCPAPGCAHAVRYLEGEACREQLDVTCACAHAFCLACGEEAHRPVPCATVRAWIEKHASDSETANWVLANTKHCPECRRPIEKNMGCMHMTCSNPCRHEFCWLCLGPWKGQHDGGYYDCNRYNAERAQGKASEDELRRRQAKASVDRYLHYYERWAAHERSGKKAREDMAALAMSSPGGESEALAKAFGVLETELDFLTAAYRQVAECRRMLRWTYAYGYYLENPAKLEFVEALQSDAEASLERLHGCAEEERAGLVKGDDPAGSFAAYREKLASLTLVTRNHFENLARAFKNDLAE
ncbi:hypothetical protein BRADI_4g37780v3, partial [Brachypodium distachyon]